MLTTSCQMEDFLVNYQYQMVCCLIFPSVETVWEPLNKKTFLHLKAGRSPVPESASEVLTKGQPTQIDGTLCHLPMSQAHGGSEFVSMGTGMSRHNNGFKYLPRVVE